MHLVTAKDPAPGLEYLPLFSRTDTLTSFFSISLTPLLLFLHRIKASGLKLQLCTNETQATRENFVRKLRALGFDISVAEVTAPAPAACHLLKERGLRPHLLVHDGGTALQGHRREGKCSVFLLVLGQTNRCLKST